VPLGSVPTWLVAGLGNPGSTYRRTRHNVGFLVVDQLVARDPRASWLPYGGGLHSHVRIGELVLRLVKPQTYMNRSGRVVAPVLRALGLASSQLVVIHDDVDLPLGRLRVKAGGGHGGHNGLRSIEQELAARDYLRVRVGIGRPPEDEDLTDWVLGPFDPAEDPLRRETIARAADAVTTVVMEGWKAAANRFNAKPRGQAPASTQDGEGKEGEGRRGGDQDST